MRSRHLRPCAGPLLLVVLGGCATPPAYRNQEVLFSSAACGGVPEQIDSYRLAEARLRPDSLTFHYVRADPPGECWLIRFAESPAEQHPEELRSLRTVLATLRHGKKDFLQDETVTFPLQGKAAAEGVSYRFGEDSHPRYGLVCLWHRSEELGGWVYVLNIVGPEPVPRSEAETILKAVGALR